MSKLTSFLRRQGIIPPKASEQRRQQAQIDRQLNDFNALQTQQRQELDRVQAERKTERQKFERQRIRGLRRRSRFGSFDESFNQAGDNLG